MRKLVLGLAVALALSTAEGRPARAATQAIRGVKLLVKGSKLDPKQRKVFVSAAQDEATIVGDPTVASATLRLVARGPGAVHDQTFSLPAAGWRRVVPPGAPPGAGGFQFRNAAVGGAITSVWIGRGVARDGQPGSFKIKIRAQGESGALAVLPPGPGTEGGAILSIGGGDRYCITFGGEAGGTVEANHAGTFALSGPTGSGCPDASGPGPSVTPRPSASTAPD